MRIASYMLLIVLCACSSRQDLDCATPGANLIENCLCQELNGDKIEHIETSSHSIQLWLNNDLMPSSTYCGAENSETWSNVKIQKVMIALPVMIFGMEKDIDTVRIEFIDEDKTFKGQFPRKHLADDLGIEFTNVLDGWRKARFQAEVLQNKQIRERLFNHFVQID